ncbi:hypothetical protein HAHE_17410 [Haloferula helveola]|uniref:DUF1254 domain-containing protein n=1 Tax=Haloferula helveola TaxID=490095 RepID=A0ABM7RDW3_9BACT|nr:hypothetical protein HAHE_17410 [Haloferula helveola]
MKTRNRIAIVLLVLGMLQMTGYLVGSKVMRGLGLATGIAPFPKVFCEADGYEAFAASFRLEGRQADGTAWTCDLDPERYARLEGPYNRRNVYGATLAFAPRLPEDLRDPLLAEALDPSSTLRRELDIPADVADLRVTITPRDGEAEGPWTYP